MTESIFPPHLVHRLQEIAAKEKRSPSEVLESMLNQYVSLEDAPHGTLAALAKSALDADLSSPEVVDTAERSREILNNEYANYLKRRTGE